LVFSFVKYDEKTPHTKGLKAKLAILLVHSSLGAIKFYGLRNNELGNYNLTVRIVTTKVIQTILIGIYTGTAYQKKFSIK
jgi:hypothetical protein